MFILFAYAYPQLVKFLDTEELPWWKVSLLVEMILSTCVSAVMNTYWMYLIIHQIVRMIRRT